MLPGEWSSGDEPGRFVASPPAPSGPETGSGVDLVHLTDLADLAELADEEVVTSWRSLSPDSSGRRSELTHADPGSELNWARRSASWSHPAGSRWPHTTPQDWPQEWPAERARSGSAGASEAEVVQPATSAPLQPGIFVHNPAPAQMARGSTPAEVASKIVLATSWRSHRSAPPPPSLPANPEVASAPAVLAQYNPVPVGIFNPDGTLYHPGTSAQGFLQEVFTVHVMCDFTPRAPKELSTSRWTTLEQLFIRLQQHAPTETTKLERIDIRQLITEWFKDHPAFAGLPYSAWCKRLKDNSPQAHARSLTFKFCFEYTPGGRGT